MRYLPLLALCFGLAACSAAEIIVPTLAEDVEIRLDKMGQTLSVQDGVATLRFRSPGDGQMLERTRSLSDEEWRRLIQSIDTRAFAREQGWIECPVGAEMVSLRDEDHYFMIAVSEGATGDLLRSQLRGEAHRALPLLLALRQLADEIRGDGH